MKAPTSYFLGVFSSRKIKEVSRMEESLFSVTLTESEMFRLISHLLEVYEGSQNEDLGALKLVRKITEAFLRELKDQVARHEQALEDELKALETV